MYHDVMLLVDLSVFKCNCILASPFFSLLTIQGTSSGNISVTTFDSNESVTF